MASAISNDQGDYVKTRRKERHLLVNSLFSHDVIAIMLVPLIKETAAVLVSQTNPQGIEFYSYANFVFSFG